MPDLRETRRKLKIAIGAMVAVDVIAAALMVSPLIGSTAWRKEQLNQLWLQLQAKTHQVEPLRGLDKKIPLANQQIDQFYQERFPSHDSEVAEAMSALAKANGVKIDGAKYEWGDPDAI